MLFRSKLEESILGKLVEEDEEKRQKEEIQKLHDEFIEAIEVAGKAKEAELRQV